MGGFLILTKMSKNEKYDSKIWDTTFNSSKDILSLIVLNLNSVHNQASNENNSGSCLRYISHHVPWLDITQVICWWIWKLHYTNFKGKFLLSPQEQSQGPRFKVASEGLAT